MKTRSERIITLLGETRKAEATKETIAATQIKILELLLDMEHDIRAIKNGK